MLKLRAIVFDVDGTLADTEEVHRLAFNEVFDEYQLGWHWSPALYTDLLAISGGRERIAAYGRELRARFDTELEFQQFVAGMHREKTRRYAARLTGGGVVLRPGIRRLIDAARKNGIAMAVATSSARSNFETLMNNNFDGDWQDWFTAVETCDSVADKKPSPAVYKAVLKHLQCDRDQIVALEDTRNGLLAARAAGLTTVITTHRYTQDDDFTGAALVADSAGEPEQPFTVAQGNAHGRDWLTLDLLDALLCDADTNSPQERRRASA